MKITFTQYRNLTDLSTTVKPGDVLESSVTVSESLLKQYVDNGIAVTSDSITQQVADPLSEDPQNNEEVTTNV